MAEKRIVTAARKNDLWELKHWIHKGQHLLKDTTGVPYGVLAFKAAFENEHFEIAKYILSKYLISIDYSDDIYQPVPIVTSFSYRYGTYPIFALYDYALDCGYPIRRNLIQKYIDKGDFNSLLLYYFLKGNSLEDFETNQLFFESAMQYMIEIDYSNFINVIDSFSTNSAFIIEFNYGLNYIIRHMNWMINYNISKIDYLLNKGANSNYESQVYNKPIIEYINSNYHSYSLLTFLIEHGADLLGLDKSKDNVPILFILLAYGHICYENIDYLKNSIKHWDGTDDWGRNALHYYFKYVRPDSFDIRLVRFLIEHGINPNFKAVARDKKRIILAKMNNTLPWGYGKTPKQIVQENLFGGSEWQRKELLQLLETEI